MWWLGYTYGAAHAIVFFDRFTMAHAITFDRFTIAIACYSSLRNSASESDGLASLGALGLADLYSPDGCNFFLSEPCS